MPTTNQNSKELLSSQMNANDQSTGNQASSEIIMREKIPNTPFHVVHIEQGWFLALGKYRISEYTNDRPYLEKLVHDKDWTIILDCIAVLTQAK